MKVPGWFLSVIGCLLVTGAGLRAALVPYTPDASTLHLWHLDELSPPCADAVPGGTNLTALANGAVLNHSSFPGFGTALSTADGGVAGGASTAAIDACLSARTLANGSGDNVSLTFADPVTGAFTFEAIIRIDFDPTANLGPVGMGGTGRNLPMQIFTGDQDGSGGGVRSWQLRLDPTGFNPNADGYTAPLSQPAIEFININNGASVQNFVALIPTNGVDAIASNQWYHIAVAYDGNAGATGNLTIYWTLLDTNRSAANALASRQMNLDLIASGAVDLAFGNTGRTAPNNNFIGLIDEVRVSKVARTADGFYFTAPDTDGDGLPDPWETLYFGDLSQAGTNDFDLDTYNHLAEYTGGSNPTNALSTPLDTDADGLPDSWEQTYFSSLGQSPTDDFDADGYTNGQEYVAGTNPANAASNPGDTDADGLPDVWEQAYFGNLTQAASGDPDGDGHSNQAEYQAGTNPANAGSLPAAPAFTFIQVEDGNSNTSEFGYAGSSSINTVNFVHEALHTENGQQFIAYYYRHATNASDPNNNRIVIARRNINTNVWQMFFTTFTANAITDGHDVASFGIDGAGFMHLSWGMHGDAFHYAKTTTTVFGTNAIVFGPDTTMTGNENSVTYPQWFRLPDGDLLYLFREGASGSGDTYMNRYDVASQTWTNVHTSGGQQPFLKGRGWAPDYNAYPNMPAVDSTGTMHLIWTWRYNGDSPLGEAGYQTNHDFDYARSTNGGLTWIRQNGVPYSLPINQANGADTNFHADKILTIPEGFSLINQAGMCLDQNESPVIATWWAPGTGLANTNTWWSPDMGTNNFRRQYMVSFRDANGAWLVRKISNRTNDPVITKYSESFVRDLGRPVVVCDPAGRLIVLYRDNFRSNGLTIAHSLPFALDPQRTNWTTFDLTTSNLGNYEPVIDQARWALDQRLHIVYQPSQGQGYTPPANTAAQIAVVEWNAAAYFAHRPRLGISIVNQTNASLSFNSQLNWGYRIQTSTNLTTWATQTTLGGVGGQLQYVHTNSVGQGQRFWRVQSQEGGFAP